MKKGTLCFAILLLSAVAHADGSSARAIVKSMRMVDLAIFKFERSMLAECKKHSSESLCLGARPELDKQELENIYASAFDKVFSAAEMAPMEAFFNSENGRIFNEIVYKQTISGEEWTPDMPEMTEERFAQINEFRGTDEWRRFESKIPIAAKESEEDVRRHVFSKTAEMFEKLSVKRE